MSEPGTKVLGVMGHPLTLLAWSAGCLVAASLQAGFSVGAFLAWGIGVLGWLFASDAECPE
jgi:hypothetical protein